MMKIQTRTNTFDVTVTLKKGGPELPGHGVLVTTYEAKPGFGEFAVIANGDTGTKAVEFWFEPGDIKGIAAGLLIERVITPFGDFSGIVTDYEEYASAAYCITCSAPRQV
jgi:hypothetical protein